MNLDEVLSKLKGVTGSGKQFSAKCPAHDDKKASLSISVSDDNKILINCHKGCKTADICAKLGIEISDLFPENSQKDKTTVIAGYVYKDHNGKAVAKKIRRSDKSFYWLKPDGKGNWTKGRNGKAPLYNQYDTKDSECIYVVEGEKDVETLKALKWPAVSLPDGAKSKWYKEYTEFFRKKRVCIIQDNDDAGKEYAQMIAENIHEVVAILKVIDLSQIWHNMPSHADVTDFLQYNQKDGANRIIELIKSTAEWQPTEQVIPAIKLSDIQSTKTKWLWYPYVPLGKITLLTADPGTGKTFLALYITSIVSSGGKFYGQMVNTEPKTVIYQTAEDGIADTIKPRLECFTPNFDNILMIDETEKSLTLSDERIEKIIKQYKPALMIFDPLQAYLGAGVDMHRANEVRPIMANIERIAEKYNVAIIFIMHNSKMGQNQALYRALGSIDFVGIARSMLILANDPEDRNIKILCHEKSSLAAHGKSIKFEINPNAGGLVFNGFCDIKADEIFSYKSGKRNKPSVKKDEVIEQLTELLESKGYAKLDEIKELQAEQGISERTMQRAKQELQIQSLSIGFGKEKSTYWLLPGVDKEKFKSQIYQISANNADYEKVDLDSINNIQEMFL